MRISDEFYGPFLTDIGSLVVIQHATNVNENEGKRRQVATVRLYCQLIQLIPAFNRK